MTVQEILLQQFESRHGNYFNDEHKQLLLRQTPKQLYLKLLEVEDFIRTNGVITFSC